MSNAEIERYAQVTLTYLDTELPPVPAYLALIEWSKSELESCEAGMWNQSPEQLVLQNKCWSAQHRAQQDIVQAALKAGVPSDAITAITYRNVWDMVAA